MQANESEWLFELNNSIIGMWRNEDMTLTFNSDGINDGALVIVSNYRPDATGANYRIVIKEGLPWLFILGKEEGSKSFQEFIITKLDVANENKLVFTSIGGLPVGLNKVV